MPEFIRRVGLVPVGVVAEALSGSVRKGRLRHLPAFVVGVRGRVAEGIRHRCGEILRIVNVAGYIPEGIRAAGEQAACVVGAVLHAAIAHPVVEYLAKAIVGVGLKAAVRVVRARYPMLRVAGEGGHTPKLIPLREHEAEAVARPRLRAAIRKGHTEQPPLCIARVRGRAVQRIGARREKAAARRVMREARGAPERIRHAVDQVVRAEVCGEGRAVGIGVLAPHVGVVIRADSFEFGEDLPRRGIVLRIQRPVHVGILPVFVFDPRRGSRHTGVIHGLQQRALACPFHAVGVGGLCAVAISCAAKVEPCGLQHGVILGGVVVVHRARHHRCRAGAVACLHLGDHGLGHRGGVAALETSPVHACRIGGPRKEADIAHRRGTGGTEVNPREAKVRKGVVKIGRGISVRRLVKCAIRLALIGWT